MTVLLGDGSACGCAAGLSKETWVQACTPNDGAPLGADW
jgi:hypothetical protein